MGRWYRLIPALAVVLLFAAACGEQGTDTPFAPATPVFEGGHSGAGNFTDSTTTTTTTSPDSGSVSGGHSGAGN